MYMQRPCTSCLLLGLAREALYRRRGCSFRVLVVDLASVLVHRSFRRLLRPVKPGVHSVNAARMPRHSAFTSPTSGPPLLFASIAAYIPEAQRSEKLHHGGFHLLAANRAADHPRDVLLAFRRPARGFSFLQVRCSVFTLLFPPFSTSDNSSYQPWPS